MSDLDAEDDGLYDDGPVDTEKEILKNLDEDAQQFEEDVPFFLEEREINHPLWQKINKHLEKILNNLRIMNDNPTTDHDTAITRGRIAQVKDFQEIGILPALKEPGGPDLDY